MHEFICFPNRFTITRSVTDFPNYYTKFLIDNTTLQLLFGKFHQILNSPTAVEDILRMYFMNEAGILMILGEHEHADSFVTRHIETIHFQLLEDELDCIGYIQTTGGKCLSEWLPEVDYSFEELQRIVREAALCLKFCHDHLVIHGDVKPDNFVVDSTGRVRIIDFGCSTYKDQATGFFGTIGYMAPNVADTTFRDSYDNSIDIFSFGVFTKIIMLRLHSRKAYDWFEKIELVRAGSSSIEDRKNKRYISFNKDELELSAGLSSDQACTVLDFCAKTEIIATKNGYDRPQFANIDELLEHPLIN